MADAPFPGIQRGAGSSPSPAANPQVKRLIAVSDPYSDARVRASRISSVAPIGKTKVTTPLLAAPELPTRVWAQESPGWPLAGQGPSG
jgi:hypothetical protein